jgi:hypothetical protein
MTDGKAQRGYAATKWSISRKGAKAAKKNFF